VWTTRRRSRPRRRSTSVNKDGFDADDRVALILAIVAGLHAAVTGGVGQVCTKPGLVFIPGDEASDVFVSKVRGLMTSTQPSPLLTGGIKNAYVAANEKRETEVQVTAANNQSNLNGFAVNPSVFETSAVEFLNTPELNEEIFGPTTLLIRSNDHDDLIRIANAL